MSSTIVGAGVVGTLGEMRIAPGNLEAPTSTAFAFGLAKRSTTLLTCSGESAAVRGEELSRSSSAGGDHRIKKSRASPPGCERPGLPLSAAGREIADIARHGSPT